jgi:hypothetical protein
MNVPLQEWPVDRRKLSAILIERDGLRQSGFLIFPDDETGC